MGKYILESGWKENQMEKVFSMMNMVINILEVGKMGKNMVLAGNR